MGVGGRRLWILASLFLCVAPPALAQDPWKERIAPTDAEVVWGANSRWVKFTAVLGPDIKVYFQDSNAFAFHYDWATAHLPGFTGISRDEFARVALNAAGRKLLLGAVLFPPSAGGGGIGIGVMDLDGLPLLEVAPPGPAEEGKLDFGIQLVGIDPIPLETVRDVFRAVKARVDVPAGSAALYMPTPDQQPTQEQLRTFFEPNGIAVGDASRWATTDAIYSPGWALGKLVKVARDEIPAALQSGALRADDILVTDGVPNDLPFLSGVITLSPASDNSHVAILTQTWQVPFVFPLGGEARVQALLGKRVLLRAGAGLGVSLIDMSHLPQPLVDRILQLKRPGEISFPQPEKKGKPWIETKGLVPGDAKFVGGKAAHYGILHAALPADTNTAIGLTYDVWDAFMSTPHQGKTLRESIAAVIAKHQAIFQSGGGLAYPAEKLAELATDLEQVRTWITDQDVPADLRTAIRAELVARFPADQRLRFRSSSNLEDGEFSGAGLYESYSADSPTDGTWRAMRRVYASFYFDRAVLERLRHRVDESKAFMGVLVHRSFPDDIELANGVATLRRTDDDTFDVTLASLPGEASTVRPGPGALAEVVRVHLSANWQLVELVRPSNLVTLGEYVLDFGPDGPDVFEGKDYVAFAKLCATVARKYSEITGDQRPGLDLEYKKLNEGGKLSLVIKQVRPLPRPEGTSGPGFLVEGPEAAGAIWSVAQGEQADALALHRLNTALRLRIPGRGVELTPANLSRSLFEQARFTFAAGGAQQTLSAGPTSWTGAAHRFDAATRRVSDSWRVSNPNRTFSLVFELPQVLAPACPVLLLEELELWLEASHPNPVPTRPSLGMPDTTRQDAARLARLHQGPLPEGSSEEQISITGPQGLRIETSVHHPPPPRGITAGYTAPLTRWGRPLVVRGLLPNQTLVIREPYPRTYRPAHHNFGVQLAFEPRLSPSVTAAQKAALLAKGIVRFYAFTDTGTPEFYYEDPQGKLHKWPSTSQVGITEALPDAEGR